MLRKTALFAAAVIFLAAGFTMSYAASVPVQDEKQMEAVTRSVHHSVVKVEAQDGRKKIATGVVVDNAGHIVTTALISSPTEKISVLAADGRWIKADFLGMDPETHIAVLRAKEKNLAPLAMGRAAGLKPGTLIAVVGISPENTPAVTQGIVSSVSESRLRLNVWVMPGSSGSPVVDAEGRMVGLLRGVYTDDRPVLFEFREREVVGSGYVWSRAEASAAGMAVAIPVEVVKSIFQEIRDTGKVQRGWLGVSITEDEEGQVAISDVEKGSPAALAKILEGDVVVKINGQNVSGVEMLASTIRRTKPGQEAMFQVLRKGKTLEIKVKMGEYPEKAAHRELSIKFPELFGLLPKIIEMPRIPKDSLPKLRQWEKRTYIGVQLQETSPDLAGFFGLEEGRGLLISQVTKGGPAEKAGLRVGDLIFKADGRRIDTVVALSAVIQSKKQGDKVRIEFLRDKKANALLVEIAEEELGEPFAGLIDFFDRPGEDSSPLWQYLWDAPKNSKENANEEKERSYRKMREVYENQMKDSQELIKRLQEKKGHTTYQDLFKKIKKIETLYRV